MTVVGLDLSLTGTGIACRDGQLVLVATKDLRGPARLDHIARHVRSACEGAALVVVEGPSYASKATQAHSLGKLAGVVEWLLWRIGVPRIVVPPATLKVYATGSGRGGKPEMLAAAIRRLNLTVTDDNLVDAEWLRQYGLAFLGDPTAVTLPADHRRALAGAKVER